MDKPQGLKTLGDYRRAARDPGFAFSLYPEGKNGSPYEALKIALRCVRNLISISRANLPEKNWWFATCHLGTEYEMSNPELFHCVELMEFANTYKGFQSFERLFLGWPKRADANIRVFTSAGLSYLEAAFSFVRELGGDIILELQKAYKKYKREGNIIYADPIKFLSETPAVDDLEIRPVPDIIIRTWFGDIVKRTQKWIQENNISRFNVEREFNSIKKQLEYERNNQTPQNIEYTRPLSMSKWGQVFRASPKTVKRWREKGDKYHFDPVSPRKWRLPMNELPSEVRDIYRKILAKDYQK